MINTTLTQELVDVIVGTLLGDSSMSLSSVAASFIMEQSTLHSTYLHTLFGLFAGYIANAAPTLYERYDPRYQKTYSSLYFRTRYSSVFLELANLFYVFKDGKWVKVVPYCIFDLLTPRALAYWIMDDGQYVERGGITLCTDNFMLKEVLVLMMVLEKKYGLLCTIHTKNKSKGHYRIYISGKSLAHLRSLVGPYMHADFMYKLSK